MADETLRPNSDVLVACSTQGSANHFENVDEAAPNDADYNYVVGEGNLEQDTLGLPASSGAGTITNVSLRTRLATDSSGIGAQERVRPKLVVGGTPYYGTTRGSGTLKADFTDNWATNPAGGSWDWADIDALEIGYEIRGDETEEPEDLASHGDPGNVAPGASGYGDFEEQTNSFGIGPFTRNLTGLSTGRTYYARAYAHNSEGYSYGAEISFLTKPAAPTSVAATENQSDKVTVTWIKSTGATGYKVYEGVNLLDTLGDVDTYDDNAAAAPTITPGNAVASDGTSSLHVALNLDGESTSNGTTRTYKVKALNATGDSDDSDTDTGYRIPGALTYQWQRSAADSDAAYGDIIGATTEAYNDTGAPANGQGRYYRCVENADGAVEQISAVDRGYRWIGGETAHMAAKMIAGGLI